MWFEVSNSGVVSINIHNRLANVAQLAALLWSFENIFQVKEVTLMKIFQSNTFKQVLPSTNSAHADPHCLQMFFQY